MHQTTHASVLTPGLVRNVAQPGLLAAHMGQEELPMSGVGSRLSKVLYIGILFSEILGH